MILVLVFVMQSAKMWQQAIIATHVGAVLIKASISLVREVRMLILMAILFIQSLIWGVILIGIKYHIYNDIRVRLTYIIEMAFFFCLTLHFIFCCCVLWPIDKTIYAEFYGWFFLFLPKICKLRLKYGRIFIDSRKCILLLESIASR
jgi:hypothetical protein